MQVYWQRIVGVIYLCARFISGWLGLFLADSAKHCIVDMLSDKSVHFGNVAKYYHLSPWTYMLANIIIAVLALLLLHCN